MSFLWYQYKHGKLLVGKGEIDAVSYGTAIALGRILKCQLILDFLGIM